MALVVSISEKLGEIKAFQLQKPKAELRKRNRIRSIQSSLEIEGNALTEKQVTALLENQRVLAPQKDIVEVRNAIKVYDQLNQFNPYSLRDFEKAHSILMHGLISNAGKLRTTNVGILKGTQLEHIAPGGAMVRGLMKDLFEYLKKDKDLILIKSCVFHYELEFIHPFTDGNGRMGRLWQTLILMQVNPVFEYLPIEGLIKERQNKYYARLSESDKKGNSTVFVEFMLGIISDAIEELLKSQTNILSMADRIALFAGEAGRNTFGRIRYLQYFKNISAPTASRDLAWAIKQGILVKTGERRMTLYRYV